jgi:TonB-dependent SusC/RagA subfamily outer membrane receptor
MSTLLEINLLLSLVFLGYFLGLRNLTFFQWTRLYFLIGMSASVLYPVLRANQVVQAPAESIAISLPQLQIPAKSWPWESWFLYALLGISTLHLLRMLMQFAALRKIHKQTEKARFEEHEYRESFQEIKPFSFLRWIYIHSGSHSRRELLQILKHEEVHVRELHTLDVLLAEFCRILCWYNPAVILLNRAVKDNLEFGVDHRLIHTGMDKVSYQHSLVGIALNKVPHPYPGNEFAFKSLKRRILMMNRNPSHRTRLFTYAVLLPVLLIGCVFLNISCQKETVESMAKPQSIALVRPSADTTVTKEIVVVGRPLTKVAGMRFEGKEVVVEGKEVKSISVAEGPAEVVVEGKRVQGSGVISSRNYFKGKADAEELVMVGKPTSAKSLQGNAITVEGRPVVVGRPVVEGKPVTQEAKTVIGRPIYPNGTIQIRGTGSLDPDKRPLLILDGVEIDDISTVLPDDIHSITVLKDASAEKAYGTKAKNGVIVITTKSATRH